jgi:hypothetical protein
MISEQRPVEEIRRFIEAEKIDVNICDSQGWSVTFSFRNSLANKAACCLIVLFFSYLGMRYIKRHDVDHLTSSSSSSSPFMRTPLSPPFRDAGTSLSLSLSLSLSFHFSLFIGSFLSPFQTASFLLWAVICRRKPSEYREDFGYHLRTECSDRHE